MAYKILNSSDINNFEMIMEVIEEDHNFEHIADIIYYLDRYDTSRNIYDPELKAAIFTVVKKIVDRHMLTPIFGVTSLSHTPNSIPRNSKETLEYKEANWGSDNDECVQTKRNYLLFFERKSLNIPLSKYLTTKARSVMSELLRLWSNKNSLSSKG